MAGTQTQMLLVALPAKAGFGIGQTSGGVKIVILTWRKLQQLEFG
jgi:hypothetical protein